MQRYFPDRAQRLNVNGKASLSCTVTEQGKLTDCSITNEDPPDQGFGDATLKVAKIFKLKPKTLDGAPVAGGKVQVVIRWVNAKD